MKEHLMKIAAETAKQSSYTKHGRPQIGCVVALKGSVIAKGWNSDKTHTIQDQYNHHRFSKDDKTYYPPKCHAEAMALSKIKYLDVDFSRVEVYVCREFKDGSMALARPCPSCMALIKDYGIKKIHYTTPDGVATEKIGEKI